MNHDPNADLRVFISYSHDSPAHAESVLALADRLRRDGIDAWIDQYEVAPSRGWPQWMKDQVRQADFVLCVCTETYGRRFDQREESGKGLGVTWEAALLQIELYLGQGTHNKIIPLLFDAQDAAHIPSELKRFSYYGPTTQDGYEDLYRRLLGIAPAEPAPLGKLRRRSAKAPKFVLVDDPSGAGPRPDTSPLALYRSWAAQRYEHLDLIGIDAGDVQVPLDEVYVPLRVGHRASRLGMAGLRGGDTESMEMEAAHFEHADIELPQVVQGSAPRQALIFGEPGSGKTTALFKLHHLAVHTPSALGLADDAVPVFLRLRHLKKELLNDGLAAYLEHEIQELSGGRVPEGVGQALLDFGSDRPNRLLLLFDGLDELGDAAYRTEVLRRLGWLLADTDLGTVRAVVTSRRVGLPRFDERDERFALYEVRPFQDDQIAQLVQRWFRELARRGRIDQAVAAQREATILDALRDRQRSTQQLLEMASNPLLLTLLCVVVLLGSEIPRRRVTFYEQCLDVLLDRWPRQRKGGEEGPVDLKTARRALGRLAFFLHRHRRRDDLTRATALAQFKGVLGTRSLAQQFFNWVHHQVGLLVDYTDAPHYGFVHLALQEHLAALHLSEHPDDLSHVDADFDEDAWKEVFLQISALSPQGFDALMRRLLQHTDALQHRSHLLRECLAETSHPELGAFLEVLREDAESRQTAVLRLLHPVGHRPPELVEVLQGLASSDAPEVARLAGDLLASEGEPSGPEVLVLYGSDDDRGKAEELGNLLKGWQGGYPAVVLSADACCNPEHDEAVESCSLVVPLWSGAPDGWSTVDDLLVVFEEQDWRVVVLPGEPRPPEPEIFGERPTLAWRLGSNPEVLQWIVDGLRAVEPLPPPEMTRSLSASRRAFRSLGVRTRELRGMRSAGVTPRRPATHRPWVDSVTGMEFLYVPGGRFRMGGGRGFPVRVSPFWLGKTPVTNFQYGLFLQATGHPEPRTWRDRRFSGSRQPAVNVSWEDAIAFCNWLTGMNPDGHAFRLPSEAQWEFAARGSASRTYPWGSDPPTAGHACFGLNYSEDRPAEVGSFPGGAGPFDHLDLAGLVWEWCGDAWEKELPWWPEGDAPLDPVGKANHFRSPMRGGAWSNAAVDLRSAVRFWLRPGGRSGGLGFRVLFSPELDP